MSNNDNIKSTNNCTTSSLQTGSDFCYTKSSLSDTIRNYRKNLKVCVTTDECDISRDNLILPSAASITPYTPSEFITLGNSEQLVKCSDLDWFGDEFTIDNGIIVSSDYETAHAYTVTANTVTVSYLADSLTESEIQELQIQLNAQARLIGYTQLNCRYINADIEYACEDVDAVYSNVIKSNNTTLDTVNAGELTYSLGQYYLELSYDTTSDTFNVISDTTYDDNNTLVSASRDLVNEAFYSTIAQSVTSRMDCSYSNNEIIASCPDTPSDYETIIAENDNTTYTLSENAISEYQTVKAPIYNETDYQLTNYFNKQYNSYTDTVDNVAASIITNLNSSMVCSYYNIDQNIICPDSYMSSLDADADTVIETIAENLYYAYLLPSDGLTTITELENDTTFAYEFDNTNANTKFEEIKDNITAYEEMIQGSICYKTNSPITLYCDKALITDNTNAEQVITDNEGDNSYASINSYEKLDDAGNVVRTLYVTNYGLRIRDIQYEPDTDDTIIAYSTDSLDGEGNRILEVVDVWTNNGDTTTCSLLLPESTDGNTDLPEAEATDQVDDTTLLNTTIQSLLDNNIAVTTHTVAADTYKTFYANRDTEDTVQKELNKFALQEAIGSVSCVYGNRYIAEEACIYLRHYNGVCTAYGGVSKEVGAPAPEIMRNTYFGDTPCDADKAAYDAHNSSAICYCTDSIGSGGSGSTTTGTSTSDCEGCSTTYCLFAPLSDE